MSARYLLYAVVGKIFIYLIQKFPASEWLSSKSKTLERLIRCGLCLGFWVYLVLAFVMRVNAFVEFRQPIVNEFVTAAVTTMLVHLVSIGWMEQFGTVVIE